MLNTEFILRGEPKSYVVPENCSMGRYFIDCIKKRRDDDVFCVDGVTGKTLTCRELLDQVFKIAKILSEMDVETDDVVSLISENCIKYIPTLLAIYYVGAAANLLNPVYTAGELQRILNIVKPKVIFSSKSVAKNLCLIENKNNLIKTVILMEQLDENIFAYELNTVILDKLLDITDISEKVDPPVIADIKKHVFLILLSSGTTGLPKCLMLTDENVRYSFGYVSDPNVFDINSSDTTIGVIPFCHVYGNSLITLAALYSLKLIPLPSFRPELYLQCIEKYNVTRIWTVPSMVSFLANHPLAKTCDLSSVKEVICSGGSLHPKTHKQFTAKYSNIALIQVYGATELCGPSLVAPRAGLTGVASVGKLTPNLEAMIWNPNLSTNVAPMETGELCFRGPTMMKGYMSEINKDIDENGFYHTGDIAYFDKDEHFYIVGRSKEIIKYKSYQVAPAEIEGILMDHEAVADCAVIGIPDKRDGELATAFIVLKPNTNVTEKDIVDFVAERISVYKHLHGGAKFVTSIPKSTTGKVLRNKLLEMYSL